MELKDFIAETLEGIVSGIKKVNDSVPDKNLFYIFNSDANAIEFDVAVTVTKEEEGGSKKGVSASIKIFEGNLSKGKTDRQRNESVSHIKFKILPKTIVQ